MDFYADLCFPRLGESFRINIVFKKERKDFKNNFLLKSEGAMAPVAPPVPTPMRRLI